VEDTRKDFLVRHQNLRLCIVDLWHPRLAHIWIVGFRCVSCNQHDAKVNSFEDFLCLCRESKTGDKQMRALVDTVQHCMITKQQMILCKRDIMNKMLLKYKDETSDGKACITNRKHGSILSIGNRVKQTKWCESVRRTGFDSHGEVIYHRKKGFDKEGKLKNVMKGVVDVIKTTEADWGYNGWMGVAATHWTQLEKQKQAQKLNAIPVTGSLEEWLNKMIKKGTKKTTAELLEEWQSVTMENSSKPALISLSANATASPLTVSDDSESASVSPLTVSDDSESASAPPSVSNNRLPLIHPPCKNSQTHLCFSCR